MKKGKEKEITIIVLPKEENLLDALKKLGSDRISHSWIYIHESCINSSKLENLTSNKVENGKRTMIFEEENSSKAVLLHTDCVYRPYDVKPWEWLSDVLYGEPTGYGQKELYFRPTNPFSSEEIESVFFLIMEDADELRELKRQGTHTHMEVFLATKNKNLLEIFEELGDEQIRESWIFIHESAMRNNGWEAEESTWAITKETIYNKLWCTKRKMCFEKDDFSSVIQIYTDYSWNHDCDDSWDWLDIIEDDSSIKYSRPYGIPKSIILITAEGPIVFRPQRF